MNNDPYMRDPASDTVQMALEQELQPGERLLWHGRPRVPLIPLATLPISLFGLFFGGFALFWIVGAARVTSPMSGHGPGGAIGWAFPLFGLPFLLVGLGLVLSPLFVRRGLKRTAYGVTDRRVLLLEGSGWNGRAIRTYDLKKLGSVMRVERNNGHGDLVFAEEQSTYRHNGSTRTRIIQHGFMNIPEVRAVEKLIADRRALLGG